MNERDVPMCYVYEHSGKSEHATMVPMTLLKDKIWEELAKVKKEDDYAGFDTMPTAFYKNFLYDYTSVWGVYPTIKIAVVSGWAVVHIEDRGWLFGRQLNQPPWFKEVQIAEGLEVEGDGTIRCGEFTFPSFQDLWPQVIAEYDNRKIRALGQLYQLIKPAKENPLSILRRSGQPYKGLAAQMTAQLKKVVATLSEQSVEDLVL